MKNRKETPIQSPNGIISNSRFINLNTNEAGLLSQISEYYRDFYSKPVCKMYKLQGIIHSTVYVNNTTGPICGSLMENIVGPGLSGLFYW